MSVSRIASASTVSSGKNGVDAYNNMFKFKDLPYFWLELMERQMVKFYSIHI